MNSRPIPACRGLGIAMLATGLWSIGAPALAQDPGNPPGVAQPEEAPEEPSIILLVTPGPRQGYYLGGTMVVVGDFNFDRERWFKGWPGGGGGIRFGQSIFSWMDLGLAIDFGYASGTARQAIFGGLMAEAQFHPSEPLSVRAGVGFGVLMGSEIEAEEGDEDLGGVGDYYQLGVSYDFFPFYESGSGGLSISPVLQVRLLPRNNFSALQVWAGIEISYWFGLPDNQLDLSVKEAFSQD